MFAYLAHCLSYKPVQVCMICFACCLFACCLSFVVCWLPYHQRIWEFANRANSFGVALFVSLVVYWLVDCLAYWLSSCFLIVLLVDWHIICFFCTLPLVQNRFGCALVVWLVDCLAFCVSCCVLIAIPFDYLVHCLSCKPARVCVVLLLVDCHARLFFFGCVLIAISFAYLA